MRVLSTVEVVEGELGKVGQAPVLVRPSEGIVQALSDSFQNKPRSVRTLVIAGYTLTMIDVLVTRALRGSLSGSQW